MLLCQDDKAGMLCFLSEQQEHGVLAGFGVAGCPGFGSQQVDISALQLLLFTWAIALCYELLSRRRQCQLATN